ERLEQPVDDALVNTELDEFVGVGHGGIPSAEPNVNSLHLLLVAEGLAPLHPLLLSGEYEWHGWLVGHSTDLLGDRDGSTGGGVTTEHAVCVELRQHEPVHDHFDGCDPVTAPLRVGDDLGAWLHHSSLSVSVSPGWNVT